MSKDKDEKVNIFNVIKTIKRIHNLKINCRDFIYGENLEETRKIDDSIAKLFVSTFDKNPIMNYLKQLIEENQKTVTTKNLFELKYNKIKMKTKEIEEFLLNFLTDKEHQQLAYLSKIIKLWCNYYFIISIENLFKRCSLFEKEYKENWKKKIFVSQIDFFEYDLTKIKEVSNLYKEWQKDMLEFSRADFVSLYYQCTLIGHFEKLFPFVKDKKDNFFQNNKKILEFLRANLKETSIQYFYEGILVNKRDGWNDFNFRIECFKIRNIEDLNQKLKERIEKSFEKKK